MTGRPFTLTITPTPDGEVWARSYDGHAMTSRQMCSPGGTVRETLGPLRIQMAPLVEGTALRMQITAARLGPLPLPRALAPRGGGFEQETLDGKIAFDVSAKAPFLGTLIRYHGLLEPAA